MAQKFENLTNTWTGGPEIDINGAGLSWESSAGIVKLVYRVGTKVWTNGDIDLEESRSYKIGDISVLSQGELGATITSSSLQEVGALQYLDVLGDTSLAEFAYFNASSQRFGLNTFTPNAKLSILDNDIEIVAGSLKFGSASIGTYTNHDLHIISDNTPRITLKNTGEVVMGSAVTNNADVYIYGKLTVQTIISDTRVDRYSPLEFIAKRDTSIYGQGLLWSGTGAQRHLIMMANPDRLQSSEHFELARDRSYYIDETMVLNATTLGNTVVNSSISKLGTLSSLAVQGPATFLGDIDATHSNIRAKSLLLTTGLQTLTVSGNRLNASDHLSVAVAEDEVFYADSRDITIGNSQNKSRAVKIFGQVSVGVNSADSDVEFAVGGNYSLGGKKFISATSAPSQGTFAKGDVCWNKSPAPGNYVGWVCVLDGAPGEWMPFGAINYQ
jgi:hypothetical protein